MCGWFHQHKWRYSAWSDRKSPANGIEDEAEGDRKRAREYTEKGL